MKLASFPRMRDACLLSLRTTKGLAGSQANPEKSMPSRSTERINFGRIKEIIAPPNLIELQTNSYMEFLQLETAATRRKSMGLQAADLAA